VCADLAFREAESEQQNLPHAVDRRRGRRVTPPTLADLIRHAERFGGVGVYETAGLYLDELLRLRVELDAIEAAKRNGRRARRRRRSRAEQVEAAGLLAAEGLGPEAIAGKLGVGVQHARKLVSEALSGRLTHPEPLTRPGSRVPSLGRTFRVASYKGEQGPPGEGRAEFAPSDTAQMTLGETA
jgi:hypothetical protein